MNWLPNLTAFVGGIALGAFYFGGLWWTASRVPQIRHLKYWLATSFLVRSVILMSALCFVVSGGWQRLVICMIGILAARTAWIYWARNTMSTRTTA